MKLYEKQNRFMETGNHFKNGANPQSYTIRGNLIKYLLTALVCLFTAYSYGQTWQIGSPNAADVTATLNNGTLTISGTGAMQNWPDYQSTPWTVVRNNIKSVVINNGVTTIGNTAFSDCLNLTSITLPNSLAHIGDYALQITGLREIHIDNPIPPTVGWACFWAVNQSACKLYVPSGSQRSYAATLDWCFFDIVGCDGSCYDIYVQESKHIRLELHKQLVSITSEQLTDWLSNLDRVYEKYAELMGGNTPSEGNKIVIQSVGPEITAWARAVVGGNHIYWNSYYVSETLNAFVNNGDWSFGIMHEMGHNFDKGTEPNWVFHAEITANFKPFYALDALADCKYDNKNSLQDQYEDSYSWSVQDDGDDDRFGDKITLGYINVARKYGWDVIKETFRSYWDNSYPYAGSNCQSGKFNEFVDRLEYFSGSPDIRSECFDEGNWLATIEKHYPRTSQNTWQIGSLNPTDIIATLDKGTLTISGIGAMQDWGWGGNGQRPPWDCVKESITNIIVNDGITTIGFYAFIDCTNAFSINIGKDVHSIKGASLWNCPKLTEIHCNNPTPPWVDGDDTLWGVSRTNCKVYVPTGSVNAYKSADVWKGFSILAEVVPTPCKTPPDYDVDLSSPIINGTHLFGQSVPSNGCIVYRMSVTSGKKYFAWAQSSTFNAETSLYNSLGTQIKVITGIDKSMEWESTYTGYAYIQIKEVNNNSGSFTLHYGETPNSIPPANDQCVNAITLSCGVAVSGTMAGSTPTTSISYDRDPYYNDVFYKFTTTNAGTYTLTLTKFNSSDDIDLTLFPNSCSATKHFAEMGANGMTETMSYNCSANTTYIVRVNEGSGISSGSFTISLSCPSTCKTPPDYDYALPIPTTSWQTRSDSILSGGCYVYRISVTSGQKYTFKTGCGDGAAANFDSEIFLYDDQGTFLTWVAHGACESGGTKIEDYQFNYDGYAYVRVKGFGALGESTTYGNYTLAYKISEQSWQIGYPTPTDVIARFERGTLTINGTGAMQDWIYNHTTLPWYCVKDEITNVVINSGVTTIGNSAFLDCISLASVIIPNGITKIGEHSFQNSCNLTSVNIPNSVTYIGEWAFGYNDCSSSLTDITVNWTTPFSIEGRVFAGAVLSKINLHVPSGTQCAYAVAPVWKDFNIVGASFSIAPSAGSGGSISPNSVQTVKCGSYITFTATPNNGNQVDQWILNGSVVQTGGTTYTISNVQADATLQVTFKDIPTVYFTITATAGSGGSISPSGEVIVNQGANQTFTFTPNINYEIEEVKVDGIADSTAKSNGYYTFSNVTADHKLSVTFKPIHPITTDVGVIVNGVKWATRNVDRPGTFAASPESSGWFYQWNRKTGWSSTDPLVNSNGATTWDSSIPTGAEWTKENDPCPIGWRVPTLPEIQGLLGIGQWTTINGVNGRRFTDPNNGNSIFLPAAGARNSEGGLQEPNNDGFYRTSWWQSDNTNAAFFVFGRDGDGWAYYDDSRNGMCVRCVTPFVVPDETQPVGADGKGTIGLSLSIPSNATLTGSFEIRFPEGMTLNEQLTILSPELLSNFTLAFAYKGNNTWLIEIKSKELRSFTVSEYRRIMDIAYNVDDGVQKGTYKAAIMNLDFLLDNNTPIKEDLLTVTINVEQNVNVTPIQNIHNKLFYVYFINNMLRIESSEKELITIYSVTGVPLYSTMKDTGLIEIPFASIPGSLFIIKGSISGAIKIAK